MLDRLPPARDDFDSDAAWGRARALYFKNLPKRQSAAPVIIEKVVERIVQVEVEKIVEVPVEVEIPAFLQADPIEEFIAFEKRSDESMAEAADRLMLELEILLNRARSGPLSEKDEARKLALTSGLGRG